LKCAQYQKGPKIFVQITFFISQQWNLAITNPTLQHAAKKLVVKQDLGYQQRMRQCKQKDT